jgi:hypothetical protein
MGTRNHGELSGELIRGRSRLEAWRARRQGSGRIPRPLWALAVRLAKTHGLSRTALALRLDYYSLKKHLEAAAGQRSSSRPAFVELSAPVVVGKQCLFELNHGTGTSRRVQLLGYELADVERLARSFWSGE